jgi:hypothetical protein
MLDVGHQAVQGLAVGSGPSAATAAAAWSSAASTPTSAGAAHVERDLDRLDGRAQVIRHLARIAPPRGPDHPIGGLPS